MHPILLRHPRGKGESLADYCIRLITTQCTSSILGVRANMIGEVLQFHRDRVAEHTENAERVREGQNRRHVDAKLSTVTKERDDLRRAYLALKASIPTSISVREAEEARMGAFRRAREAAAIIVEYRGIPTNDSEAIRAIPDIKPKWMKA